MKPHRIRMTHSLILNYGLYKRMEVFRPPHASKEDLTKFHTDEYINFLRRITPENLPALSKQLHRFNVGEDCPAFEGVYEYSQISAGGSIAGAVKLNQGESDICINWAGGLHHAKKAEASGFCYINDIVLAILELLKTHARVLYIDIDVHHGDGVEEAFYTTDRVLTVSFHKHGEFFPGTGDVHDIGAGRGKQYSVNFPLRDGIDDESYESIFRPVISHVIQWYQPGAVVLQCGADSLAGDRLGCFNLSHVGHGRCVEFVRQLGLPLLVLGGGGYTIRNVARAWTYETSLILNQPVPQELPYNEYLDYYGPDYLLKIPVSNMPNLNTREYLDAYMERIIENLRHTQFAPGVQMHSVPDDLYSSSEDEEYENNGEIRSSTRMRDRRRVPETELSDSEDEGYGRRNRFNYHGSLRDANDLTADEDIQDIGKEV